MTAFGILFHFSTLSICTDYVHISDLNWSIMESRLQGQYYIAHSIGCMLDICLFYFGSVRMWPILAFGTLPLSLFFQQVDDHRTCLALGRRATLFNTWSLAPLMLLSSLLQAGRKESRFSNFLLFLSIDETRTPIFLALLTSERHLEIFFRITSRRLPSVHAVVARVLFYRDRCVQICLSLFKDLSCSPVAYVRYTLPFSIL